MRYIKLMAALYCNAPIGTLKPIKMFSKLAICASGPYISAITDIAQ